MLNVLGISSETIYEHAHSIGHTESEFYRIFANNAPNNKRIEGK